MDADTRHQLKQNELAEALGRLREFDLNDRRLVYPLAAVVLILLGFAGMRIWNWQQERALEADWAALMTVENPASRTSDLRGLVQSGSNPEFTAFARLRLANGLLRSGLDGDETALDQARAQLQQLTEGTDVPDVVAAGALFNLGIVHETDRDVEAARATFERLGTDPRFAGSPFASLAAERLDQMDALTETVSFEPGFAPAPAPVVPTTTGPAPAPVTTTAPAEPTATAPAGDEPAAGTEDDETASTTEPNQLETP